MVSPQTVFTYPFSPYKATNLTTWCHRKQSLLILFHHTKLQILLHGVTANSLYFFFFFFFFFFFLFTQGMPKQLKTGFHWGPACVNIKIEYREYGNPRQNNNYIPHHK